MTGQPFAVRSGARWACRSGPTSDTPLVTGHDRPPAGASSDGFELLTTFGGRAQMGRLVSDFYAWPGSRSDVGNALIIDLSFGTPERVTDLALFGGANALPVVALGLWEIVQASQVELLAPSRYRLTLGP